MVARKAVAVVVGGILVHLTLGTIYTFGNMTPYLTSYLRQQNVSDVTYGDSVWIFAASALGQGTSMTFGGFLEQKVGTRASVLLGAWTSSLGVILTYFSIKQSFILTVITYGLMFGLGVGVAYAIPMACAMRWLPLRKGLVNGMVVAGFGGGAFIFDYVQTGFINPRNLKPVLTVDGENYFDQASVLDKVPYCFLLLGGVYAGMQLIGVLLLFNPQGYSHTETISPRDLRTARNALQTSVNQEEKAGLLENEAYDSPPENTGQFDSSSDQEINSHRAGTRNPGYSGEDSDVASGNEERVSASTPQIYSGEDASGIELSPLQILKRREFYKLWFTFLMNGTLIVFVSTLYKAYGQTFIHDDLCLAIVGAFAAVFNAGGRIMWGRLSDRFSYRVHAYGQTFIHDDLFLAIVGAFAAVFNAGGRIMWGRLSDRFSYRIAMMILCGCMAVLLLTFQLTNMAGKVMYFIWVCLIFLTFSGNFSLFPTVTTRTFGQKHMVKNYGLVFTSQVIASPIGAVLSSQLKDVLGWNWMFIFLAGLSVLALMSTFTFRVLRKDGKREI